MITLIEELNRRNAALTKRPQLLGAERKTYDRLCVRLARARSDGRRATERGDTSKLAAAERAIARTQEALNALLGPVIGQRWAPDRIIMKLERSWHRKSGTGIHQHTCEMILDHKDLVGPEYRTVCVLGDEGSAPTSPWRAPDRITIAWSTVLDRIRCGQIVVLGAEEPS